MQPDRACHWLRAGHVRHAAITAFVLAAAASRLLPHPPNFTAVPAMALFSGALFGRGWLAYLVPLAAMVVSDLVLGATLYGGEAFRWLLPVYACVALTVWIGKHSRRSPWGLVTAGTLATATFFVLSNLCVWWFSGFYAQTAAGLLACYGAALPYARNMWLATVLFAAVLQVLWTQAERRYPALRAHPLHAQPTLQPVPPQ